MKIFVLTGPTASGKTSLAEYLLLKDSDMLAPLVSFTTRAKLPSEVHGRDYYFINGEEYLNLKISGQIAQEIHYLSNHYGLSNNELLKLEQSRKNGLAVIGMPGVKALKQFLGEENIVSLFVYRDLAEIQQELEQREISNAEKEKRFELVKEEMREISYADHVIYNIGNINVAYQKTINIIRTEINNNIQNTFKPGLEYRDASGKIYEAIELVHHYSSWQSEVLFKDTDSGAMIIQPLRQFVIEMVKI